MMPTKMLTTKCKLGKHADCSSVICVCKCHCKHENRTRYYDVSVSANLMICDACHYILDSDKEARHKDATDLL